MNDNNNTNVNEAWIGRSVRITGTGGAITVENDTVKTTRSTGSVFSIERAPHGVRFRYGAKQYLTIVMYGDACRQATVEALANLPFDLLPETIHTIGEFGIVPATNQRNFEGAGYCYQPMTLSSSKPNSLNTFDLQEHRNAYGRTVLGVRTRFASYWRSEHWNRVVSQAPHCEGDEQWNFRVVAPS